MAGSMDGLSRVTRATEAYYHQIELAKKSDEFPVAIIEGMNHYQWASGEFCRRSPWPRST